MDRASSGRPSMDIGMAPSPIALTSTSPIVLYSMCRPPSSRLRPPAIHTRAQRRRPTKGRRCWFLGRSEAEPDGLVEVAGVGAEVRAEDVVAQPPVLEAVHAVDVA